MITSGSGTGPARAGRGAAGSEPESRQLMPCLVAEGVVSHRATESYV